MKESFDSMKEKFRVYAKDLIYTLIVLIRASRRSSLKPSASIKKYLRMPTLSTPVPGTE